MTGRLKAVNSLRSTSRVLRMPHRVHLTRVVILAPPSNSWQEGSVRYRGGAG
jgi:hypothetical protein